MRSSVGIYWATHLPHATVCDNLSYSKYGFIKWNNVFLTLNRNIPYKFQPLFLGCPLELPIGRHFCLTHSIVNIRNCRHCTQLNWEWSKINTIYSTIYLIITLYLLLPNLKMQTDAFLYTWFCFSNCIPWARYTGPVFNCSWYLGKMESCCRMWSLSQIFQLSRVAYNEYCCDKDLFSSRNQNCVLMRMQLILIMQIFYILLSHTGSKWTKCSIF